MLPLLRMVLESLWRSQCDSLRLDSKPRGSRFFGLANVPGGTVRICWREAASVRIQLQTPPYCRSDVLTLQSDTASRQPNFRAWILEFVKGFVKNWQSRETKHNLRELHQEKLTHLIPLPELACDIVEICRMR